MRRFSILLVAAVAALSPIPAASAHGAPPSEETSEACPAPDVVAQYRPDRMSVSVSLPMSGCPTREDGAFSLQVWVSRVDEHTGEGHGRVVGCGEVAESSGTHADTPAPSDVCELDMWIGHPSPEAAYYDVEVTYPGAEGEETIESHSFCTTGDDGAFCVAADAPAEDA